LHKLTSYLTENYALIAIEDLNVKGMLANRRLSRAIADMGFHEFRRQLDYKTRLCGNHLEVVNRWFASSKTLLRLWIRERRTVLERAPVSLRAMRIRIRSRPKRGTQSIPYGELHRNSSLWRGRLWLQLTLE
jgi:IS605 OrfB family transposase